MMVGTSGSTVGMNLSFWRASLRNRRSGSMDFITEAILPKAALLTDGLSTVPFILVRWSFVIVRIWEAAQVTRERWILISSTPTTASARSW